MFVLILINVIECSFFSNERDRSDEITLIIKIEFYLICFPSFRK